MWIRSREYLGMWNLIFIDWGIFNWYFTKVLAYVGFRLVNTTSQLLLVALACQDCWDQLQQTKMVLRWGDVHVLLEVKRLYKNVCALLTQSVSQLLTQCFTQYLTQALTHSLTQALTQSPTRSVTQPPLTHPLNPSINHLCSHLLIQSVSHSLTH